MSESVKIVAKRKTSATREGLADFRFTENELPELQDSRLQEYHSDAWKAFESLPFPSSRDEPWRRTDIRLLQTSQFTVKKHFPNAPKPPERFLEPIVHGKDRGGEIVSGAVEAIRSLNPDLESKGVIFSNFHTAEIEHPELMKRLLGQIVSPNEDKFTALAAALAQDGVVLYVPKDVVIEEPIHSLILGDGSTSSVF